MSVKTSIKNSRRSLAIGIWTASAILIACVDNQPSIVASICLLVFASVLVSAALLLFHDHLTDRVPSATWSHGVPGTLSLAILLAWAIKCGIQTSLASCLAYATIGTMPICLILISRHNSVRRSKNSISGMLQSNALLGRRPFALVPSPQPCGERVRMRGLFDAGTLSEPSPILQSAAVNTPANPLADSFPEHRTKNEPVFEIDSKLRLHPISEVPPEEPSGESILGNPDVIQWLKRSKTVDGEAIEGWVRVEFASGQKDVTIHIAFCPPFSTNPRIETEDLDGMGLEIKVAVTFPFGARLTVRRSNLKSAGIVTESPQCYRIGFVAMSERKQRAA